MALAVLEFMHIIQVGLVLKVILPLSFLSVRLPAVNCDTSFEFISLWSTIDYDAVDFSVDNHSISCLSYSFLHFIDIL